MNFEVGVGEKKEGVALASRISMKAFGRSRWESRDFA
jgi:hypothetical protein